MEYENYLYEIIHSIVSSVTLCNIDEVLKMRQCKKTTIAISTQLPKHAVNSSLIFELKRKKRKNYINFLTMRFFD